VLGRHVRLSGLDLVVDLERSQGSMLTDARDGAQYLDLLGFYGSLPLGMNPPALARDAGFRDALAAAALHKVTNADLHTAEYARFTAAFARVLGDPELPHLFFIDGGALAVENALKAAFDWKAQRRGGAGGADDLEIMHLENAFHGRGGYTLSLTNTSPAVSDRFPAWNWPRLAWRDGLGPAARYLREHGHRVAAFVAEPIQGAGGDVHVDPGFLRGMQELCHAHDVLFVLDEVQTGCGASGTPWVYQQLGLAPDIVAFGKKTQVCGVMAGRRVGLVDGNVFVVPDRIGSTWGGNLADMVRATRIFEVIEERGLIPRAGILGAALLGLLNDLARSHPGVVRDPRGRGLLAAFDLPGTAFRNDFLRRLRERERVLLLPGGACAVRFRPSLTVTEEELAKAQAAIDRVLTEMGGR
jgi:L-lysine 6-transaminase